MGLGTFLFLIFFILKLTHHISWSWWWVASPLLIEAIAIGVVGGLHVLASWELRKLRRREQRK